jgi:hypothetical protein
MANVDCTPVRALSALSPDRPWHLEDGQIETTPPGRRIA